MSILEPALQGWGRPWVVCAPAVHTTGVVINNRSNILFGCGTRSIREGLGLTPHTGYPRGVCAYTARILRFSLGQDPGEAVLPTTLPVGVCVVQTVGMTTFPGYFHGF